MCAPQQTADTIRVYTDHSPYLTTCFTMATGAALLLMYFESRLRCEVGTLSSLSCYSYGMAMLNASAGATITLHYSCLLDLQCTALLKVAVNIYD